MTKRNTHLLLAPAEAQVEILKLQSELTQSSIKLGHYKSENEAISSRLRALQSEVEEMRKTY